MKKILPWVIAVLAVGGLAWGYMQMREARLLLDERLKASQDKVDALGWEIGTLKKSIDERDKRFAEYEARALAREKWFQQQLAKVDTATPQQLVDEGSRILEASDISTDGVIVTMSVETWRRAVRKLLNEEEYRLVREPGWVNTKTILQEQIADLKLALNKSESATAGVQAMVNDLKQYIASEKAMTVLEKALWATGGAGAGYVLGHLTR